MASCSTRWQQPVPLQHALPGLAEHELEKPPRCFWIRSRLEHGDRVTRDHVVRIRNLKHPHVPGDRWVHVRAVHHACVCLAELYLGYHALHVLLLGDHVGKNPAVVPGRIPRRARQVLECRSTVLPCRHRLRRHDDFGPGPGKIGKTGDPGRIGARHDHDETIPREDRSLPHDQLLLSRVTHPPLIRRCEDVRGRPSLELRGQLLRAGKVESDGETGMLALEKMTELDERLGQRGRRIHREPGGFGLRGLANECWRTP
jgi:hypothetical protein